MKYDDENMLMLSGIQHFMFCPRQWGLIHLLQEWEDNRLTTEGQLLHKRVDNPFYRQKMVILLHCDLFMLRHILWGYMESRMR